MDNEQALRDLNKLIRSKLNVDAYIKVSDAIKIIELIVLQILRKNGIDKTR